MNLIKSVPWEVKSTLNKVKNAVLNYSEMEAKVREATNNDAWGASSTLLMEIARATSNYQHFNEIMPTIYKRFAESRQNWRQIYKTLQLLEYLLKHGSDRVIENAKDHLYEIKAFTSYQFVDDKSKDQGVNVRHRAKEIVDLINDTRRLKEERQKAQANRNKYQGVASDEVRYGGAFANYSPTSPTGASSGGNSGGFRSKSNADYDYDPNIHGKTIDGDDTDNNTANNNGNSFESKPATAAALISSKPVDDLLFDFNQPAVSPTAAAVVSNTTVQWDAFGNTTSTSSTGNFAAFTQQKSNTNLNDGFADFQSAPVIHNANPINTQPPLGDFNAFLSPPQPAAPFVQPPAFANNNFGSFSSAPQPVQPNLFAGNGNTGNSWAQFQSAPMVTPAISSMNSQPSQQQLPNASFSSNATTSSGQKPQPKKIDDILSSNLGALDSLGKYNSNQQKQTGPSLYQLNQQPQQQQQQNMQWTNNNNSNNNSYGGSLL